MTNIRKILDFVEKHDDHTYIIQFSLPVSKQALEKRDYKLPYDGYNCVINDRRILVVSNLHNETVYDANSIKLFLESRYRDAVTLKIDLSDNVLEEYDGVTNDYYDVAIELGDTSYSEKTTHIECKFNSY